MRIGFNLLLWTTHVTDESSTEALMVSPRRALGHSPESSGTMASALVSVTWMRAVAYFPSVACGSRTAAQPVAASTSPTAARASQRSTKRVWSGAAARRITSGARWSTTMPRP